MNIPIVIAAYNRDCSFSRLLSSIAKGYYDQPVKLIISIDGGGPDSVKVTAHEFKWDFGPKEVIEHETNLGLRSHILFCGDLTKKYDGVILLEDDLYVSPSFYEYTLAALEFYKDCESVCGIGLYSYNYNETSFLPFFPLNDGSDTYFMQLPCSWGQAWLNSHWSGFINWYNENLNSDFLKGRPVPSNIEKWPETSWKKYFSKFMIENDRFFVYPFHSYSTNFGDVGQHHQGSKLYQVPVVIGKSRTHNFVRFESSLIKYDSFGEMLPECLRLLSDFSIGPDVTVDLHGTKRKNQLSNLVLTSKKCSSYIKSFGREMLPIEMNVINSIEGCELFLTYQDQICFPDNIDESIISQAGDMKAQKYYYCLDDLHFSSSLQAVRNNLKTLHRYQELESSFQELSNTVRSLHCSLSWRFTSPFRKLLGLIKHFLGNCRF